MKLAFLAAANSIHSIRWIKYFAEKKHAILWISLAPASAEALELVNSKKGVIEFHEIKPSPLADINGPIAICYLPFAVWQIKKILKEESPNIFHVHSAGTYGLVGALSGFKPTILTPWGSDILLTSPLKKPLVKYAVRRAAYFTCDGENTRIKLIELGADPKKISIIRFGVDVKKFEDLFCEKCESPVINIISLRNLEPVYDIETLVRAAKIVVEKMSNVKFLIAGDGSERQKLEYLAEEGKLISSGWVKFTGRYKAEDLPRILGRADIYVSTSLSDSGLAASTAEAMAAGLPAVVSDSGDNRYWVRENQGGFVVPVKNPQELAKKIIALAENHGMRKKFGKYNLKVINEENNYYKEMEKMEKLYLSTNSENSRFYSKAI